MRFEKVSLSQYLKDFEEDVLLLEGIASVKRVAESAEDIYRDIKLPQRATLKSAGYDFFAPYEFTLNPGDTIRIATGIRVILDDDKFLMCAPRSGHGFKARIQLDNTIGIIDADYSDSKNEGHIMLKLTNDSHSGKSIHIDKGAGMMQAIIQKYYLTEDDDTTEFRNGGMGSTDKKEGKNE